MSIMTSQQTPVDPKRSCFLRRALVANASFSGLSGVIILMAAKPLASLLGPVRVSDLTGLAISLIIFSVVLFRTARSARMNETSAWIFVVLDLVWVIGSAALIVAGVLTIAGNWIIGIIAD